jgi:hypothetical protein
MQLDWPVIANTSFEIFVVIFIGYVVHQLMRR